MFREKRSTVRLLHLLARWSIISLFLVSGISHFALSPFFVAIVPPYLPAPLLLVYVSGFFELAGAIGLIIPATRRIAAWGLVALMIAVLPANLHMAFHPELFSSFTPLVLWLRIPLQALLIACALWVAQEPRMW